MSRRKGTRRKNLTPEEDAVEPEKLKAQNPSMFSRAFLVWSGGNA